MKPKRIRTWEEIQALPEGRWVESAGIDFEVVDRTTPGVAARAVIPLRAAEARRLRPRKDEVLEATVRGQNLELVRRSPKRAPRA
jgi:hypothetical protein